MSINVYCYDNGCITPLEVTDEEKEKHVDLLYLKDNAHDNYCLIQSLSRLFRSQVAKHEKKTFLCKMCLNHFCSEEKLKNHKSYCDAHKSARIEMPKPYDNIIQFKNYNSTP